MKVENEPKQGWWGAWKSRDEERKDDKNFANGFQFLQSTSVDISKDTKICAMDPALSNC